MVTDTIQNIALYNGLSNNIKTALDYIAITDFEATQPGKYTVKDDEIFAIVNEYITKDKNDCECESHKKYIDIQFMVKGVEVFGFAPLNSHLPVTEYNEDQDVAIYKVDMSYIALEAGMFIIFYPSDIHQPEIRAFEPLLVKKVVMKIRV